MNWRDVPLPNYMARLAKDPRGLPVPFVATWAHGRAHFTVVDQKKVAHCLRADV